MDGPFVEAGFDYHALSFGRFFSPLADWRALKALSTLIADLRPRLIQCFDTKPDLLVPLAARGNHDVKVVSTINGIGLLYFLRSPLALGLQPVYESLQRLAAGSTAVTVFQNRDDQAFFASRRMLGPGDHLVIPGSGIDVESFKEAVASGPTPSQLREALGLATSSEIVMTVARMTRQKGIPTLLEAAALVHKARPGVRFVLVGPREEEGAFAVTQAEIERHAPYVQAIGRRSDVPCLLGVADVFAFPSEYPEGIPRVLLEAAIAGCPIVTSRMPGCSEVVRDGWNGYLVPPRAPRELADRILDLLRDRGTARVMSTRAAEFVGKQFNLEITVERYKAVYDRLMRC